MEQSPPVRETTTRRLLFAKCSMIVSPQLALNFSVLAYLSIYNLWVECACEVGTF